MFLDIGSSLERLNTFENIYIAFSGGADSTALLHLLSQTSLKQKLIALHVNHGLQADANQWQEQCQAFCQSLDIGFESVQVSLNHQQSSIENQARQLRYQFFAQHVTDKDVLCTGHHQDDLTETVLFRVFRGASLAQLNPIKSVSKVFGLTVHRPLLHFNKSTLMDYCQQNQLSYIEDPSNQMSDYDRNYIRRELIPMIKNRWSALNENLEKLSNEAEQLNQASYQLFEHFIQQQPDASCLAISSLQSYPAYFQKDFIYRWLHNVGETVSHHQYQVLDKQLQSQQKVSIALHEHVLNSFQGQLYMIKHLEQSCEEQRLSKQQLKEGVVWAGGRIQAEILCDYLTIKPRLEGMDVDIKDRGHRPLKKLLQEWKLEPWLRHSIPHLAIDNQIVAIADYAINPNYISSIQWLPASYRAFSNTSIIEIE